MTDSEKASLSTEPFAIYAQLFVEMLHQRLSIGSNDVAAKCINGNFTTCRARHIQEISMINVLYKVQVANDNHYSITLAVVRKNHLDLSLKKEPKRVKLLS